MATQALVQQLQHRIERIETSTRVDDGQTISSGCTAIDRLLPGNGYRRGTLIEWVSKGGIGLRLGGKQHSASGRGGEAKEGALPCSTNALTSQRLVPPLTSGGCGADFLSLVTAANACADGGALVIADRNRQFYPPAAAAMGVDLGNVVVIRPPEGKSPHDRRYDAEFFWAIDQALGCSAVAAVWGSVDHVGERWFRRFQLSAEASGTMGLFVRPASAIGQPGWSEVQWHVTAKRSCVTAAATQHVELKLARCRGGRSGKSVGLQIDAVTGNVSQLETSASPPTSRDATGHRPSQREGVPVRGAS